jgi:hypothetical protein
VPDERPLRRRRLRLPRRLRRPGLHRRALQWKLYLSNWWCAPREPGNCGAQNFSVACSEPDGSLFYCPTHAICKAGQLCICPVGYLTTDCSGNGCSGDCTYPNWWCH